MTRGEIWWAHLPDPAGRRPVVLLSRPEAYALLTRVVVAEVTSHRRPVPTYVDLSRHDGVDRPCAVNLDSLHTLARSELTEKIAALSMERMRDVDAALRFSLALA